MGKTYTVVTITFGDGEVAFGHRIQSITFKSAKAANEAAEWLTHAITDCKVKIVEDWA